jgi:hypothetical protein
MNPLAVNPLPASPLPVNRLPMNRLLAGFDSSQGLQQALERLREAGIDVLETYTPGPVGTQVGGSTLPLAMCAAGMAGFVGCCVLMTYADVVAYPLNIGGRPAFAWPAFVPIAFEVGALCAMVAGFFGYFMVCRMPQLYDPVDECDSVRRASRDGWFVAIATGDPESTAQARAVLDALQPTSIEAFRA